MRSRESGPFLITDLIDTYKGDCIWESFPNRFLEIADPRSVKPAINHCR